MHQRMLCDMHDMGWVPHLATVIMPVPACVSMNLLDGPQEAQ